jgi:endonuclease III
MINPSQITNHSRTLSQLQEFWLFCILVAGKNADQTANKLSQFLSKKDEDQTPFDYIADNFNSLHNILVANKVGQYGRIEFAFKQSLGLDLECCTVEQLEAVYGVGPKTARFFLVHTRPNQRLAILDMCLHG